MKNLILKRLNETEEKEIFIHEIQKAFQNAYVEEFGKYDKIILPRKDIEESFNANGAEIYFAEIDGERVGGAVIVINNKTNVNSLDLLYVKSNVQNSGIGYKLWKAIEDLHCNTKIWETYTPYFDKRNIHFYVNRLGFKIVEFFNPRHKDKNQTGDTAGNIPMNNNFFFRFEKEMK